jgi:hypothetical protein
MGGQQEQRCASRTAVIAEQQNAVLAEQQNSSHNCTSLNEGAGNQGLVRRKSCFHVLDCFA